MVLLQWAAKVGELVCLDCHPAERHPKRGAALRTLRTPGHEVELAVSPLAGMRGFAGYHTSVLVGGEEYYFCPMGICYSPKLVSHEDNGHLRCMFVGLSQQSGSELLDFLTEHFRPGTYDLLRKNCNSFTDCALHFLCEQRLDHSFRVIEQLGRAADEHVGLVQKVSGGDYTPNPAAAGFDVEAIIALINDEFEGSCDALASTDSCSAAGTGGCPDSTDVTDAESGLSGEGGSGGVDAPPSEPNGSGATGCGLVPVGQDQALPCL